MVLDSGELAFLIRQIDEYIQGIVTLRVVGDGMLNECLATCTVAIDFRRRSFHIVFGSTFVLV
jgi:hypothetical protein